MKAKPAVWLAVVAAALLALAVLAGQGKGAGGATQEERRIAQVLSAIAGAGKVEVALYAGKDAQGIYSASSAKPTGAVIVAQGAGDLAVRLQLIRAVRTLLSLPENAVDVFVMGEGNTK